MSEQTYPFIEVGGSHFEMGVQHGQACPDRVNRFVEIILDGATSEERTRDQILLRTRLAVPLMEEHCPGLLEETRGLAEGARISFEEAVLLQLRGEVGNYPDECTTFAVPGTGTATGEMFIGQNSDMGPAQEEVGIVLRCVPDRGPRILMWTFAGHLGYHGMNSEGVAHFANALGGGPAWKFGLSHYPLKRMILEQRTVDEVLQLIDGYPVCSSGNYMLCGGCGNYCCAEVTPEGYGIAGPGEAGFLAHSNHFLCSPWGCEENYEKSLKDSFERLDRMNHLILNRLGEVNLDDIKAFVSDHQGHPTSICRHDDERRGKTVCSLIAEPESGCMHVCKGNPCEGEWMRYEV